MKRKLFLLLLLPFFSFSQSTSKSQPLLGSIGVQSSVWIEPFSSTYISYGGGSVFELEFCRTKFDRENPFGRRGPIASIAHIGLLYYSSVYSDWEFNQWIIPIELGMKIYFSGTGQKGVYFEVLNGLDISIIPDGLEIYYGVTPSFGIVLTDKIDLSLGCTLLLLNENFSPAYNPQFGFTYILNN